MQNIQSYKKVCPEELTRMPRPGDSYSISIKNKKGKVLIKKRSGTLVLTDTKFTDGSEIKDIWRSEELFRK